MAPQARGRAGAVARLVGEGSAIVGQQGVDPIWERLDYASQESGSGGHVGGWVELDAALGDAIDGQEEEDLALGRAQLAGIDVDVTDLGLVRGAKGRADRRKGSNGRRW